MKIIVIDYQLGNIYSIINMLKKIGVEAVHSNKINDIQQADKIILPGVGAFDHGMENLKKSNLIELLNEEVLIKKKPFLGICLGMQLLLNESEEGTLRGLGWIKGKCVKFKFASENSHFKVPHMGWNIVKPTEKKRFFQDNISEEKKFYFVHSYYAVCENMDNVIGIAQHGNQFPAIISCDHIIGAQFHPEKSHKFGMQFLNDFIENKI